MVFQNPQSILDQDLQNDLERYYAPPTNPPVNLPSPTTPPLIITSGSDTDNIHVLLLPRSCRSI